MWDAFAVFGITVFSAMCVSGVLYVWMRFADRGRVKREREKAWNFVNTYQPKTEVGAAALKARRAFLESGEPFDR